VNITVRYRSNCHLGWHALLGKVIKPNMPACLHSCIHAPIFTLSLQRDMKCVYALGSEGHVLLCRYPLKETHVHCENNIRERLHKIVCMYMPSHTDCSISNSFNKVHGKCPYGLRDCRDSVPTDSETAAIVSLRTQRLPR
jgi:hypothetical protein